MSASQCGPWVAMPRHTRHTTERRVEGQDSELHPWGAGLQWADMEKENTLPLSPDGAIFVPPPLPRAQPSRSTRQWRRCIVGARAARFGFRLSDPLERGARKPDEGADRPVEGHAVRPTTDRISLISIDRPNKHYKYLIKTTFVTATGVISIYSVSVITIFRVLRIICADSPFHGPRRTA